MEMKELLENKGFSEDNAKYYGHFGAGARTSLGPKLQNYKTLVGGWAVTS